MPLSKAQFHRLKTHQPSPNDPEPPEIPCACSMDLTGSDAQKVLTKTSSLIQDSVGLHPFRAEAQLGKGKLGCSWRVLFYCTDCSRAGHKSSRLDHRCIRCKDFNEVFNLLKPCTPRGCSFRGASESLHSCMLSGSELVQIVSHEVFLANPDMHFVVVERENASNVYFLKDPTAPRSRRHFNYWGDYVLVCDLCRK